MVTASSNVSEPQPGDRLPAPGDLKLVQAFVNSFWDLSGGGGEQLVSPWALSDWLAAHGLISRDARLDRDDLERALDVREGLRALLFVNNGAPADHAAIERLNAALRAPGPHVQLDATEPPRFLPLRRDLPAALASFAMVVAVAQIEGTWERLKACPGERCGWAFYDHSRNQSGSWCSMSVCGSRSKAREYRRRNRGSRA
jgi:predicted RNA-binding Zn ribbon-like protein